MLLKSGNFRIFRFRNDEENKPICVEMTFFKKITSFCEKNVQCC